MTTIRKATKGFSAFPRDDGEFHPRNYFKKRKVFSFLARIILHFLNELEKVVKASRGAVGGERVHERFSSAFHNQFKLRHGLKYDLNSLEKCSALGTFLLDLDRSAGRPDWVQKARVAWAGEKLLMNKFPFRIFYCVLFHLSFPIPARVRKKCDKSVFSRKHLRRRETNLILFRFRFMPSHERHGDAFIGTSLIHSPSTNCFIDQLKCF